MKQSHVSPSSIPSTADAAAALHQLRADRTQLSTRVTLPLWGQITYSIGWGLAVNLFGEEINALTLVLLALFAACMIAAYIASRKQRGSHIDSIPRNREMQALLGVQTVIIVLGAALNYTFSYLPTESVLIDIARHALLSIAVGIGMFLAGWLYQRALGRMVRAMHDTALSAAAARNAALWSTVVPQATSSRISGGVDSAERDAKAPQP